MRSNTICPSENARLKPWIASRRPCEMHCIGGCRKRQPHVASGDRLARKCLPQRGLARNPMWRSMPAAATAARAAASSRHSFTRAVGSRVWGFPWCGWCACVLWPRKWCCVQAQERAAARAKARGGCFASCGGFWNRATCSRETPTVADTGANASVPKPPTLNRSARSTGRQDPENPRAPGCTKTHNLPAPKGRMTRIR